MMNKNDILARWLSAQTSRVREVEADWLGTGQSDRLARDTALSLAYAVDFLIQADELWLDSDGVSINGRVGGMTFGCIGRLWSPAGESPELAEWARQSLPILPCRWSIHS
jgi:hypothetical protein